MTPGNRKLAKFKRKVVPETGYSVGHGTIGKFETSSDWRPSKSETRG